MIKKTFIWLARIIPFLAVLFFLVILIGEWNSITKAEDIFMILPVVILIVIALIGLVISLSKRAQGGKIIISSSVCLGFYFIILGGPSDIDAALIFSLPFLIPGLLLYFL